MLELLRSAGASSPSEDGEARPRRSEQQWLEYEQRRADWANAEVGHLNEEDGYDCPLCKNRGYFRVVDPDGHAYSRECECMPKRRNMARIRRSGLEDMVKRYTFDTWQTPEPWQEDVKIMAEKYVTDKKDWFVACGPSGTGKSHICTAICNQLMAEGKEVQYVLWRNFVTRAKAAISNRAEYEEIVNPLTRIDVLYIDDLFKTGKGQDPTDADVNVAFEVLNDRYNSTTKLTIISTEFSMPQMVDIDEAVGSRIYERAKGHSYSFAGKKNWRIE